MGSLRYCTRGRRRQGVKITRSEPAPEEAPNAACVGSPAELTPTVTIPGPKLQRSALFLECAHSPESFRFFRGAAKVAGAWNACEPRRR